MIGNKYSKDHAEQLSRLQMYINMNVTSTFRPT